MNEIKLNDKIIYRTLKNNISIEIIENKIYVNTIKCRLNEPTVKNAQPDENVLDEQTPIIDADE
jgi:hypothetical protein